MTRARALVGIVTFNPEIALLSACIDHASSQSPAVVVFDNASANITEVRSICSSRGVGLIESPANNGIANALNSILQEALKRNLEFALLLDQDSLLLPGSLEALERTASDSRIALAASSVADRNAGTVQTETRPVAYAITSGSLVSTSAWREIGGYDERLFIDFVDFDFCVRARADGYQIVRTGESVISHAIGAADRKRFGTIYNYSPFRLEHMAADMVYFARKHRHTPPDHKPRRSSRFGVALVLARKAALISLYETSKIRKVGALITGAIRGARMPRLYT
ncbi:glycosyltransferase [Microbacterium sp. zg.B48]|uniref:glycosyltransferase n=1 Tax=Microbacterium sp. zg.B48 TaxID=2969408 RepID=UPI00214CA0F1|nr:glycosyltransferase [Microbacterium sp. zg.B48]MCR2764235.1 glycosyltransferase [Microbacterium sp. zg.B48]